MCKPQTRAIFEHLPEGYSQRLGNRTAMRRLGFWLELLEIGDEAMLQQLVVPHDRNYAPWIPAGRAKGQETLAGD